MQIAVSGYMGSGKSFLSEKFSVANPTYSYIDLDSYAKDIMNSSDKIKSRLADLFGAVTESSGSIDYKKLSNMVFSSENGIEKLNSIVHPEVILRLQSDLKKNLDTIVDGAVIPLWKDLYEYFDIKIWIEAPKRVRANRIQSKRSDLSKDSIEKRILKQIAIIPEPDENWIKFENFQNRKLDDFIKLITNGVSA